MKERAAAWLKKEQEEMHMMARRIQAAWRIKNGGIAKHLKMQAMRVWLIQQKKKLFSCFWSCQCFFSFYFFF